MHIVRFQNCSSWVCNCIVETISSVKVQSVFALTAMGARPYLKQKIKIYEKPPLFSSAILILLSFIIETLLDSWKIY